MAFGRFFPVQLSISSFFTQPITSWKVEKNEPEFEFFQKNGKEVKKYKAVP